VTKKDLKNLLNGRQIRLEDLKELLTEKRATMPPACMSVEMAAEMLGVGRAYAFRLIKEGALASIKLGRRRLIPHAAIEALIASRMQ
jgi:excisionase family DNA binding protein